MKLQDTEYLKGFAEGAGMTLAEAAEQVSAMKHYFDPDSYEEGLNDGAVFKKIFPEGK
jgi:hypothetical protein